MRNGGRAARDVLQNRIHGVVSREQPKDLYDEERPNFRATVEELKPVPATPETDPAVDKADELNEEVTAPQPRKKPVLPEALGDAADSDEPCAIECIYLSKEAAQSPEPYEAVKLNADITGYFLDELHYRPNEICRESYLAYAVHLYVRLVLGGGHVDFVEKAGEDDSIWNAVREGLDAVGADAHVKALNALISYMVANPELVQTLATDGLPEEAIDRFEHFDQAMIDADSRDPAFALLGKWLKDQPSVMVLENEELNDTINAFAAQPAVLKRHEEFLETQAEEKRRDPFNRIGMAIASKANLEFERWGEAIPEFSSEDGVSFEDARIMVTDVDPAIMVRSGEGEYTLFDHGSGKQLATLLLEDNWDLSAA